MFTYMAMTGELLVLAATVLWMTEWAYTGWLYAAGAAMLAVGRLAAKNGDGAKAADRRLSVRLRRLYRQRVVGAVLLLMSAVLINVNAGFIVFGMYLRPSVWLIPFTVFVIIEVYTAFRIPAVEAAE